jgi:fumarate hydratase class II
MAKKMRIEKDLLGELEIPAEVYWGINTQRALMNFQISEKRFPKVFLFSLAKVKKACLIANRKLGVLDTKTTDAIKQAISELLDEQKLLDQFPIDVYQTGSGTQINMNMNEVVANRANELLGHPKGKKAPVHPNDHVNKSQSSNDVIPTTMHLTAVVLLHNKLLPALKELKESLQKKIAAFHDVVKIGRTHLQDAVPIPLTTELSVYHAQIAIAMKRIKAVLEELYYLPIGGTAVGTGLNAPEGFDALVVDRLSAMTGYPFKKNPVKAEGIATHNTIAHTSSVLKLLALSLTKLANDIRWMGSGPRAGLGELILPQNEPGSSIMPGKINPTQAEVLIQVCLQVIGNDTTIAFAEGSNSLLDLNVAKPLMIINLVESITILSNAIHSFNKKCLQGLEVNHKRIKEQLERSLMIVTRLSPEIGYDKAGELAKKAHESGKTIKEIVLEEGIKLEKDVDKLLNPKRMV